MEPVNQLYGYGSSIALINIHDLNPNNKSLNQRRLSHTKSVPLQDPSQRIR